MPVYVTVARHHPKPQRAQASGEIDGRTVTPETQQTSNYHTEKAKI